MSTIGNQALPFDPSRSSGKPRDAQRFNGDGATLTFTLSLAVDSAVDIEVYVDNIPQEPLTAYDVNGTSITFTEAPPVGAYNVRVIYRNYQTGISTSVADGSISYQKLANNIRLFTTDNFTGDNTTVAFALTTAPADANTVFVSIDGIVQRAPIHYTTSGTTITFTSAPPTSSNVHIRHLGFRTTSTVTALSANTTITQPVLASPSFTGTVQTGAAFTGNLSATGTLAAGNTTITGTLGVTGGGLATATLQINAAQPNLTFNDTGGNGVGLSIRSGVQDTGSTTGNYTTFNIATGKAYSFAANNVSVAAISSSGISTTGTLSATGTLAAGNTTITGTLYTTSYVGIGTTSPTTWGAFAVRRGVSNYYGRNISASFSDGANSTIDVGHTPNSIFLDTEGSTLIVQQNGTAITNTSSAGLAVTGTLSASGAITGNATTGGNILGHSSGYGLQITAADAVNQLRLTRTGSATADFRNYVSGNGWYVSDLSGTGGNFNLSSAGILTVAAVGSTTAGSTIASFQGGGIGQGVQIYEGTNSSSAAAPNTVVKIGQMSSTGRSIGAAGTINASGADYAEYMTKATEFVLLKGGIAGINSNGKITNVFADAVSFVVKSTSPSYVGGDTWGSVENVGVGPKEPTQTEGEIEEDFVARKSKYEADLAAFEIVIEAARNKVDRIAFSGQVPVNVLGATAGQYIIPVEDNGAIKGQAVSKPTFEQYQIAVGKVICIESDGRAKIIVKVA